ncbi:hypothetical protein Xen7305DRAFT_00012220 [Xenococcus sp. PCC 7305]|nr:hypothetical protein Xen7305DRAFT_00012220 [Xenococcus sp. PCC 7305]
MKQPPRQSLIFQLTSQSLRKGFGGGVPAPTGGLGDWSPSSIYGFDR